MRMLEFSAWTTYTYSIIPLIYNVAALGTTNNAVATPHPQFIGLQPVAKTVL